MIRSALALIAAVATFTITAAAPAPAAQTYPIDFHTFALGSSGSASGTVYSGGALRLDDTAALPTTTYTDPFANANGDGVDGSGVYSYGTWTSDVYQPGFAFNELVSSWNAQTPAHTWIQVAVKPQLDDGHWAAKWYVLGRWAYGDSDFHRTSVGGQGDADGFVSIDTFFAKDHTAIAYRLQLTLYRGAAATTGPSVTRVSAVTSNLTNQKMTFPSASTFGPNESRVLDVPQFSQETHHGEYPEFDGGGEAWCSPTSTSMVVAYWGAAYAPTSAETSTIPFADPQVDYTARQVFDYHYDGAGNWPFNAAYAAGRGLVADVMQLHDLREAEAYIRDGIPLVASIAFQSNKLAGADIKSTNGHLAVIVGFTDGGKEVIVNDPASPTNGSVKHLYDREQFERAWIPASGGIVYVIRPAGWPMP
jgi:hypothetical protein